LKRRNLNKVTKDQKRGKEAGLLEIGTEGHLDPERGDLLRESIRSQLRVLPVAGTILIRTMVDLVFLTK
jgi:hypothetical protein